MSGPPSLKSLVCEEVFDERSQPSEEEVREYAVRIGIDPDGESHLIPLAREGLLKPLPKNWKPVYDQGSKRYYYFNFKTKQTSWEHPLDSRFRELVKKSRSESLSSAGEDDSKTSIKEELKSFEEAAGSIGLEQDTTASSRDNPMDFLSQGVPALKSVLSPLRTRRKEDHDSFSLHRNRSKPLTGKNDLKTNFTPKPLFSQSARDPSKNSDLPRNKAKAEWDEFSAYDDNEQYKDIQGHRSGSDAKYTSSFDYNLLTHDHKVDASNSSIIGRFTVDKVRKIDIDSQTKRLDTDGGGSMLRSSDRFSKSGYGHPEFTLSGGGSVFLKSNKRNEAKKVEELSRTDSIHDFKSDTHDEMNFDLSSKEPSFAETSKRNIKSSIHSLASSPTASGSSTRSILRTPQAEKRLWDLDPQHMSVSEKALWKQQELEEEKKSVRFNLDKELNISFKLSDSSESDSPSEEEHGEDEDIEFNSNGSEDLAMEFKMLRKGVSRAQLSPTPKQRRFSPLEEWAKDTWFSKKPSLAETADELKALSTSLENNSFSDFGFRKGNVPEFLEESSDKKEDDIEGNLQKSAQGAIDQNEDQRANQNKASSIIELAEADPKSPPQEKSGQNLLLKENLQISDIDDFLTSSPSKKSSSPVLLEHTSPEANLIASLTKKLKGITSRDETSVSREARAREQALRDWNVKQTDGEMYRPPLSRQQSQQQLLQIKHQMHEPAKAEDRDRALRAWNVTDSATTAKSSSIAQSKEAHVERSKVNSPENNLVSGHLPVETDGNHATESVIRTEDVDVFRSSIGTRDLQSTAKDIEERLDADVTSLKMEYEMQLDQKKQEYKTKLEAAQQEIVQVHQEKLERLTAEETEKIEQKSKEIVSQMERESDLKMKQLREQLEHKQSCATQKILEQHQQALAAQEVENQAAMLRFREQHSAEMKTLREQFQREEEQMRREQQDRLINLREDKDGKRSREITDHLRAIEKLRCEKRLVEDKYRILKEKYVKLKGEMKASIEKKEQKLKETYQSDEKARQNQATVVDQEASVSQIQQQSDRSSETESRPKTVSAGSSATSNSLGFHQFSSHTQHLEQLNPVLDPPPPAPNSGPSGAIRNINNDSTDPNVPFLGMRYSKPPFQEKQFASSRSGTAPPQPSWCNFAHYKTTERNGNVPISGEEIQWSPSDFKEKLNEMSPLEALRHQLQTLDELEEQFPVSSVTDAYLRYPFSDSGGKQLESAELEFFRHRIHLERDMIRQAKTSLQAQQSEYRTRMHNFQQRQSSSKIPSTGSTLYQMAKEEQELSDMESKLRRTRTVLSEKMIHLRHLENSLNRLTAPTVRIEHHGRRMNGIPESRFAEKPRVKHHRRWDWKNGGLSMEDASDVSSDSGGSSGFSSTEYTSDGTLVSLLSHTGSGHKLKRTPENTADINLSLHNLNAEISEIWNVLCKQRAAAGLDPPPLLNSQGSTRMSYATQPYATPVASTGGGSQTSQNISKVMADKNSSLIERTNNLRQWLQKAKMSASLPTGAPSKDRNEGLF